MFHTWIPNKQNHNNSHNEKKTNFFLREYVSNVENLGIEQKTFITSIFLLRKIKYKITTTIDRYTLA